MPRIKVCVGSKNPAKIEAVKKAFEKVFPEKEINCEGVNAPSGVPDQPIGSQETFDGALNRAKHCREHSKGFDYWVGLEGGNIRHDNEMEVMAWMVVLDQNKMGKARTAGFFIAPKTVDLINQGYELGKADEMVFGIENSKQKMGSSGLLTDNLIPREEFYIPALIFALIPFKKPELFALK